jgi:hypothetical protein
MAVYAITGAPGSGKGLVAVSRCIRDPLRAGCRVATNLNINLEYLVAGRQSKYELVRVPDYPTLEDLEALGYGSEHGPDEKKFGWLVLDEASTFLNTREWNVDINDEGPKEGAQKRAIKRRMDLIRWLRHVRHFRWHLVLVTQGIGSLESQVREELLEHEVTCRRMDRLSVPVLSWLTKMLGFGAFKLPQVHVGVVYYRELGRPTKVDTWYVSDAKSIFPAYDTEQNILGECLGASMLDARRAPYMWKPRGRRELIWEIAERIVPGLLAPSAARQRYNEFRLFKLHRGYICKPGVSFAEWCHARAAHAGPLGGEAGEAAEPAQPESYAA